MSLNTWIVFCIMSAMWGIRLWLRSSWPAGCVVIRPWFLSKCFQCMPMMKYTTSRQPGSKSLQFFFACDPPASKALYSLRFKIKLQFGDCGPVCPGGATAHALKKDCATSCTCSVPFRNSELAKIKQLCRNILLYTLPTVSLLGPHLLITNI